MRRILVEAARRKQGPKHGGRLRRIDANFDLMAACAPSGDLLALDEALTKLAKESPPRAELVKLRFFAGMTLPEAAEVLGISQATAERYWTYARTWLYAELSDGQEDPALKREKSGNT
jgi:RNA polymerase sigma factor (TIGR02999 family)